MKRDGGLVVYFVRDESGLLTGRLVERGWTARKFAAAGASPEPIYEELALQLERALREDPEALEVFLWEEGVHTERVRVDVRPQLSVQKRSLIGKQKIPLLLTYAWARLPGEAGDPAGYRVMLPRFGWSFVLEELSLAADVLSQSVSSALAGESARSVFEFREGKEEYFLSWSPKLLRKQRGGAADAHEPPPALNQTSEDWTLLARAGRLGIHIGAATSDEKDALLRLENKPSILLVGPSGVGKTEWVRQLARRAAAGGEAEPRTRVWATSAERIIAGMSYLGMWEQRCLDLVSELSGEGDFFYVDRLSALAQTRTGESSIADLFLSALKDGEISMIAECNEQEYERLLTAAPSLVACFELVRLEAPSPEAVAELVVEYQERKPDFRRLHPDATRRLLQKLAVFRRDHAFPGKAFAFLGWLQKEQDARATEKPRVGSASPSAPRPPYSPREADHLFSRYTGLPEILVSDDELGEPSALAELLARGVVGQAAACRACADVLVRFKAGVSDPEKPVGSLLFVGPTGVGKTELAKQLARFLFGSAERMIRLDMSEYMTPGSTRRLLSDQKGDSSLAQRVSQEPLSLILLDEIEKADPAVFDLLLGVLGEGRLTAGSGRLIDFRMTLIVMTSNLGSEQKQSGFARVDADSSAAKGAVRQHFRPEFFNRLDYIVPFDALTPEALRRIVKLELDALRKRDGLARRSVRLRVSEEAEARLAELGFHPKYGARPLKRAIEEHVMTPIAIEISRRPKLSNVEVRVGVRDQRIEVLFSS